MRILTVVVNYKTGAMAARAVDAALAALPSGAESQIVVVDNDSGDDSMQVLTDTARAHHWGDRVACVANTRNGGFGCGNNLGIAHARSLGFAPDQIYLLNPDAIPAPDALTTLQAYLAAHPRAGIAGSAIIGTDGTPHRTAFRFPSVAGEFEAAAKTGPISKLLRRHVVAPPIPRESGQVDWVAGCSMLIRRQVLEQIGGFDESFFLYFEETDLCRRAREAGWTTAYVVESRVAHEGSASTGMKHPTRPMPSYWFDSRWHYLRKHHGATYAGLSTAAQLAGSLVWQTRKLVEGKQSDQPEPEGYLRDLSRHTVRRLVDAKPLVTREMGWDEGLV